MCYRQTYYNVLQTHLLQCVTDTLTTMNPLRTANSQHIMCYRQTYYNVLQTHLLQCVTDTLTTMCYRHTYHNEPPQGG
jgi:uncharacterized protein (DUF2237 family)